MSASGSALAIGRRSAIVAGAALATVLTTAGSGAQAPNANAFAGQTPISAMIVTGGPFHDYTGQSKVLMDTLNAVMPINWTVVQGMSALAGGKLPLYDNPD